MANDNVGNVNKDVVLGERYPEMQVSIVIVPTIHALAIWFRELRSERRNPGIFIIYLYLSEEVAEFGRTDMYHPAPIFACPWIMQNYTVIGFGALIAQT